MAKKRKRWLEEHPEHYQVSVLLILIWIDLRRLVTRLGVSEAVRPLEVADRVIVWVQRVSASRYFLRVCEPVIDRVR